MQQLHDMRCKCIRRCHDGDATGCGGTGQRKRVTKVPVPDKRIPLTEATWSCPIQGCGARLA
eukprot:12186782-Alexandrium_andersonii.AAC.1